jgi:hypothetical protein
LKLSVLFEEPNLDCGDLIKKNKMLEVYGAEEF